MAIVIGQHIVSLMVAVVAQIPRFCRLSLPHLCLKGDIHFIRISLDCSTGDKSKLSRNDQNSSSSPKHILPILISRLQLTKGVPIKAEINRPWTTCFSSYILSSFGDCMQQQSCDSRAPVRGL